MMFWYIEVTVRGRRRADADRLVSQAQVRRVPVGLAEHGDCFNAEIVAGADHPQGDLASVRD